MMKRQYLTDLCYLIVPGNSHGEDIAPLARFFITRQEDYLQLN
jgi:hypothetical protein